MIKVFLLAFTILFIPYMQNSVHAESKTIVPQAYQISDFVARFEMAKILSYHKETLNEALEQYLQLSKEKPNDPLLLLQIGRTYVAMGKFEQALQILATRLDEQYLLKKPPQLIEKKKENKKSLIPKKGEIVPENIQIDENHARFELAKLLSYHKRTLNEALEQFFILFEKYPHDVELVLYISRIYLQQKDFKNALTYLYPAIEKFPLNIHLLLFASQAERGLKHPKQSEILILKALELNENHPPSENAIVNAFENDKINALSNEQDEENIPSNQLTISEPSKDIPQKELLLDYAETLMIIGSFYKSEDIYKNLLKTEHSIDLNLKLGWNFVSSQRYEEADGIYQQLAWSHPDHPKVLEALANLKVLEKNFCVALIYINRLNALYPDRSSYILLKANALFSNENYSEALQEFEKLIDNSKPKYQLQGLIGFGRSSLKIGNKEVAQEAFQQAYDLFPDSIEAQFYIAENEVTTPSFIDQIVKKTDQPEDFEKWANIYAENGSAGIIQFQEASLLIDPDYYPAQVSLAEALSTQYRYDEAIDQYLALLDTYPEASKLIMAIARVLSWGKQYTCSFEWYDWLIELNPQDPVPRKEKARVAYWGYFFDLSIETYAILFNPGVDQLLLEALQSQSISDPMIEKGIDILTQSLGENSIYTGYQTFNAYFEEYKKEVNVYNRRQIEWILIQYLPDYRIQKSMFLESYAKTQDWQNYFLHALPVYEELTVFNPGNEEALYGYAQDFCSLGLCKNSRELYAHILNIDPNHSLVQMALQRNLLKENWLLQSNYTYWKERGLGQFSQSQIARHQFDEIAEWSPSCNFHLRFMQNAWLEFPFHNHNKYYSAEGQTLEVDKQFTPYIKGSGGATYKNYFHKFPSRYTCFATVWFDCKDYFNLGLGFERRNEIYNLYSLKEAIQAKIYWGSVTSNLTHYWTMGTTYRHLEYNDRNTMEHVEVMTSYTFSDDPDIFKIILQGSYRNTAHLSKFVTDPTTGEIVNIIHPYWTPQNYYSNSITLEYRHNFAFFNYCEAPVHYLDIQVTAEEDSSRNPSLQLAFEWRRDFFQHFGFSVKGMIHQSKLWNAEGAWVNVYYRF